MQPINKYNRLSICPIFFISKIDAPKIIGIDNKNENLDAVFVSNPENNPADIVDPDLDIPGNTATAWNNPITKLFFKFNSLLLFFANLVKNNTKLVIINAMPTNKILENNPSNLSFIKKPINAAGIDAIIKYKVSLIYFLSFSIRPTIISNISFQKTKTITIKLAKCRNMSKDIGTLILKNSSTNAKCPEELTGNHSVIPCVIPNIIA